MNEPVSLKEHVLNGILNKLASEPTVLIGRFIKSNFPEMQEAERFVLSRYGSMLEFEGLAIYTADSKHPLLQMKITPKGQRIVEEGGYVLWKEAIAVAKRQEEMDAAIDRQDKLGSISDRKFNRRLAWAAFVISLFSLGWTIYKG
jgi:hypothetical protein